MFIMSSQILDFVDLSKTQKSNYRVKNIFSSDEIIISLYMKGCHMVEKVFWQR